MFEKLLAHDKSHRSLALGGGLLQSLYRPVTLKLRGEIERSFREAEYIPQSRQQRFHLPVRATERPCLPCFLSKLCRADKTIGIIIAELQTELLLNTYFSHPTQLI